MKASTDRLIRKLIAVTSIVVGLAAAIISWSGLVHLGTIGGMTPFVAMLLPIAVDGTLLLGAGEVIHATLGKRSSKYGVFLMLVGSAISIAGNMYSAIELGIGSSIIHAIAPVMLLLSTEGVVKSLRHRIIEDDKAATVVEREAKREALKAQRQATVKSPESTAVVHTPKRTVAAKTPGIQRTSNEIIDVSGIERILESTKDAETKAAQIEAVLIEFPDAKPSVIASAMGVETKTIATTVNRVRSRLNADVNTQELPALSIAR